MSKATRFDSMLDSNKEYIKAKASKRAEAKKNVSKEQKVKTLKAMADNEKIQESYAEKLVSKTSVGIEAQLIFGEFFNMGTVGVNEPLIYTLDEPVKKATINQIAMHGSAPQESLIQNADYVRVHPYQVSSDRVSMSKFSLRQGDISNEEKARKRVEKSMVGKMEVDYKALLESGLYNDINSVKGVSIDSRVKDFPTSNNLDLSSEGGLTLNVFKQIAKYYDQIGRQIRNIYIPSNRRSDIWDWMSIPAGYSDNSGVTADSVIPQALHEQVIRTGQLNTLFGYPVNLVPVNTLNGTATAEEDVNIWVNTNQPAGEYREIPRFSDTFREEDAQRIYFTMNKAIAMFQTPNNRLNYMRATIETA